jgi:16S rRNA (uracil1498-N3)-methyltransferase
MIVRCAAATSRPDRRILPHSYDMLDRFYAPTSLEQPAIELPDEEAHHLQNVLRKRVGDRVAVFDGRGGAAVAEVESLRRNHVRLSILSREPPTAIPSPAIVLATAVPKGDRARWLVEKATELGVDRWVPLQTERGVVDPGETRLDKLRQTVVAACKQCGRNRLLEISSPVTWPELLAESGAAPGLIVADPAGMPARETVGTEAAVESGRLTAAVGPEGGFTPRELDDARAAGAQFVSLGPPVLRIETAALALAALLTCGVRQTG